MHKLTAQLKKALFALAYADAGEMLTGIEKDRVLGSAPSPRRRPAAPAATPKQRTSPALNGQVGLYLGASLDPATVEYAAHTCKELNAALTVVTFQPEDAARALLAPHLGEFGREGVVWQIVRLSGEPQSSLANYLKAQPRMLFLVCRASGFLGHAVRSGRTLRMDFGLPVVLVTTERTEAATDRRVAFGR